jgi:hypothetical protein
MMAEIVGASPGAAHEIVLATSQETSQQAPGAVLVKSEEARLIGALMAKSGSGYTGTV